jgi:hypothetical protein
LTSSYLIAQCNQCWPGSAIVHDIYQLAVRGAGLVDEAEYISAVCDGPRSFQGIE